MVVELEIKIYIPDSLKNNNYTVFQISKEKFLISSQDSWNWLGYYLL